MALGWAGLGWHVRSSHFPPCPVHQHRIQLEGSYLSLYSNVDEQGSAVSLCRSGQPYPRAPGLESSAKWGEETPGCSGLESPLAASLCEGGVRGRCRAPSSAEWRRLALGTGSRPVVPSFWLPGLCRGARAGWGAPEAPGWALCHAAGGAGGTLGAPDAVVGTAALRGGRGRHRHHGLPLAGGT